MKTSDDLNSYHPDVDTVAKALWAEARKRATGTAIPMDWWGGRTNRSYWRRQARIALAACVPA